ncbi:MAG: hypothetical protein KatS3mg060_2920 [Dehalococcoidia bacterium]|nr:MAG: hypothetical protein KatS3mg060_2920 [Dehalococcoidia bacterium]
MTWRSAVSTLRRPPRLARYLVVGVVGTLLDVTLFSFLRGLAGLPVVPANFLSYGAGIVNNYLLHRRWTFAEAPRQGPTLQFARFCAVSVTALAVNTSVVVLLAGPLDLVIPSTGDLFAKGIATTFGIAWSFILNERWAFRTPS